MMLPYLNLHLYSLFLTKQEVLPLKKNETITVDRAATDTFKITPTRGIIYGGIGSPSKEKHPCPCASYKNGSWLLISPLQWWRQ
eukprot:6571199-Ditylum_brightwellii.AAC.1